MRHNQLLWVDGKRVQVQICLWLFNTLYSSCHVSILLHKINTHCWRSWFKHYLKYCKLRLRQVKEISKLLQIPQNHAFH